MYKLPSLRHSRLLPHHASDKDKKAHSAVACAAAYHQNQKSVAGMASGSSNPSPYWHRKADGQQAYGAFACLQSFD